MKQTPYTNDCVVVSLAAYSGVAYSKILDYAIQLGFIPSKEDSGEGISFLTTRKIAKALGKKLTHWIPKSVSTDTPCILIVPSKAMAGATHAVYWDGHYLHDPSFSKKYGRDGKKAWDTALDVWLLEDRI